MTSLFDAVEMAPRDPILGLNEQFLADPNPAKVNLGVGVYYDENGKLPLLGCVRAAEEMMMEAPQSRGYLPIDGIAAYDAATQALVFGDAAARREGRIATVQGVGGTGALKVGADLLQRLNPKARVLISEPSWENHRALFEGAGFEVGTLSLLRPGRARASTSPRCAPRSRRPPPGTIVVLHACCHNPTGCDLTPDAMERGRPPARRAPAWCRSSTWPTRASATASPKTARGPHVPGRRPRLLRRDQLLEELLALRRARRRALGRLLERRRGQARAEPAEARHPHQLLEPADARRGGVAKVLSTPALRAMWEDELAGMRERIKRDAPRAAAPAGRRRRRHRHRLHHAPARHVQLLRPDARRRCSACAASSASTASIPAASAWPR